MYYFVCDYVPNMANTGNGKPRKAASLATAYGTLMGGLRRWVGWTPGKSWVTLYRDMIRSVCVEYPDSTRIEQADPINGEMILQMHEDLPLSSDPKGADFYAKCVMIQHVFRFMWQGMLRFGDIRHIDCKYISQHTKVVDGQLVKFFKIELQDKPRIGHCLWRVVHIPQRQDHLDCYELIQYYWHNRRSGPLFPQTFTTLLAWKAVYIAHLKETAPERYTRFRAHGIRAGSMNDCMDVASDPRVVILQGGWSSHSLGAELYNSFRPGFHTYIRLSPVLLRALIAMGPQ